MLTLSTFFEKNRYLFLMHFVIFIWGFTGLMAKMIPVSANFLVLFRSFFAIIFLTFLIFWKAKEIRFFLSKKEIFGLFIVGLSITVHWILFFESIQQSNISVGVACLSLSSFFVLILKFFFTKKAKFSPQELWLSIMIVIGMLFIFQVDINYYFGIFLGILAALTGAIFSLATRKYTQNIPAYTSAWYQMLFSFFLILSYEILLNIFDFSTSLSNNFLTEINNTEWILLIFLGVVATAFPMFALVSILKHIPAFSFTMAVNLEPIYSILLAFLFFGSEEKMNFNFYIGFALILFAVFIETYWQKKVKKPFNILNQS